MIALGILGEEMLVPSARVKLTEAIKPKMSEEAIAIQKTNKETVIAQPLLHMCVQSNSNEYFFSSVWWYHLTTRNVSMHIVDLSTSTQYSCTHTLQSLVYSTFIFYDFQVTLLQAILCGPVCSPLSNNHGCWLATSKCDL